MRKINLIEIYIQEVTRRLPGKNRTDIALELRSTIEDMLPNNYHEEDVKEALNQLGNPAVLANGYKNQPMHLIGPRYFDLYVSLLKMIVQIAAIVALITMITQYFIGLSGEEAILKVVLTLIGKGIGTIIEMGIHVFFWLTFTFVIIERLDKDKDPQPLTSSMEKWTADELNNITYIPKRKAISKVEVFDGLMRTAIWATFYFYGNQLLGVYEGNGGRLDFVVPALNQEVLFQYWPFIVSIIGLEIALTLYKLLEEQWTKGIAICNTILQIFVSIIFIFILANPNLMNQAFLTYVTDSLEITKDRLNMWIVSGGICILIFSAAVNVNDGLKRARVR